MFALVREPLKIESWNFTCGITMLMKGQFDSFSLHFELQSCIPLFKALFLFSHCKAEFGRSIDWMVLAIQLTGWFVLF